MKDLCTREHVDPRAGIYFWGAFLIGYFLLFIYSLLSAAWHALSWIIDVFRYGCC